MKKITKALQVNTPDFVLLFIPIESYFSIAVKADKELFNYAWDRKIVIVSPSTLLATLHTIESIWKQERQTKNAHRNCQTKWSVVLISLLDLLRIWIRSVKVLIPLEMPMKVLINKLHKGSGNLVKRAKDIEKLGAKTTKQISSKFLDSDETHINRRAMNKFYLLILFFIVACGTARKPSEDTKASYKHDETTIHPEFVIFHVNDSLSELHFKIASKELLYTRPDGINFSTNVLISYRLLASYDSKEISDSSSVRLVDINNDNGINT